MVNLCQSFFNFIIKPDEIVVVLKLDVVLVRKVVVEAMDKVVVVDGALAPQLLNWTSRSLVLEINRLAIAIEAIPVNGSPVNVSHRSILLWADFNTVVLHVKVSGHNCAADLNSLFLAQASANNVLRSWEET